MTRSTNNNACFGAAAGSVAFACALTTSETAEIACLPGTKIAEAVGYISISAPISTPVAAGVCLLNLGIFAVTGALIGKGCDVSNENYTRQHDELRPESLTMSR